MLVKEAGGIVLFHFVEGLIAGEVCVGVSFVNIKTIIFPLYAAVIIKAINNTNISYIRSTVYKRESTILMCPTIWAKFSISYLTFYLIMTSIASV